MLVLNGPNLGRLGTPRARRSTARPPTPNWSALCARGGAELGLDVEVRQSDHEGELLGWLHEAADAGTPVVLNAGALTHTSVALGDACAMLTAPLVEVHISNVHRREAFRHHSYVSAHAAGVIVGLGVEGYVLALSWLSSWAGSPEHDGVAAVTSRSERNGADEQHRVVAQDAAHQADVRGSSARPAAPSSTRGAASWYACAGAPARRRRPAGSAASRCPRRRSAGSRSRPRWGTRSPASGRRARTVGRCAARSRTRAARPPTVRWTGLVTCRLNRASPRGRYTRAS